MSTSAALLELENISVEFDGVKALQNVSLQVQEGQIHGLIGPNGSGKTTLLNTVSGYVPQSAGHVRFRGKVVDNWPVARRARMGIGRTFQIPTNFPESTVFENVLIGMHCRDSQGLLAAVIPWTNRKLSTKHRHESRSLLRELGLECDDSTRALDLTYGQQRLLDIARAVVGRPEILCLDEPTAGLSNPDIEALAHLIKSLNEAGASILIIEHHVRFLLDLSDTMTVLDFGRKIAEGTPQSVRNNPRVVEAYLGKRGIRQ